jgi:hypothetical protein
MDDSEFISLCYDAFNEFVKLVPNPKTRYKKGGSTGNMALNAAKIEFPRPDKCVISIDPKIAPYMPYTNEAWVAERWHGKKNPNEGWFQRAAEYIASYVSERLQGEVEHDNNKNTD